MIDLTLLVTADDKADAAVIAERQANNDTHKNYLDSTDWLVLRLLETGQAMPPGVAALRQAARAKVV